MSSHQIALNIADADLPAAGFQIDRRSGRNLDLEIHVTHVATVAIISYDVDDQPCIRLSGIEMDGRSFHGSGNADFVFRPGLNCNCSGEVFQFNPDVFSRRIVSRHALLRERTGSDNEYEKESRKGCKTSSGSGDGRMKVHRWIVKPGTASDFSVLEGGKLLQQFYLVIQSGVENLFGNFIVRILSQLAH